MTAPEGEELGRRLREAREARRMSLRQIANSTKIAVGVLEALERGDFSRLPGGIFGRAFVRSYAQEVGLDPEGTVREFAALAEVESRSEPSAVSIRSGDHGESLFESQRRSAAVALGLILISVPLAALLLYFGFGRQPAPVPGPAPPASGAGEPDRTRPVDSALPRGRSTAEPPASPAVLNRVDAPAVEPPASTAPSNGVEGLSLEVRTTGPCWVSLTVDGSIVLSKVMSAEETVSRRVRTGALIQVGDAGAFTFSLNGQPARALGESGQVRSVQITPANYTSFLR